MPSRFAISALLVLGAGPLAACSQGGTLADTQGASLCEAIVNNEEAGLAGAEAQWVKAEAETELPAFCEVSATLSPVEGSAIGVVYRLPETWNGRMLGLGGGGWAGDVTIESAVRGLKAGYATAQTDGGNTGTGVFENQWVSDDPVKAEDFSYRAIHEMTVAGKQLVGAYYGRGHERAYFQGCSTGGRMALMEAQRFPADYDAIISMAPVYTLQVQSSSVMRNNLFAGEAALGEASAKLASDAVLSACDAADGIEDGVIADPRSCNWDPGELACPAGGAGEGETCLTRPQVAALRTAYRGVRAADGSWAQLPLSRGGEAGWAAFIATDGSGKEFSNGGGTPGIAPLLWGEDQPDLAQLSPRDVMRGRDSEFAAMYEADDPDLSAFFGRGGKLLLWHGESDPGPSPVGTIDYAERVAKAVPELAGDSMRLFLAPGVGHCAGGPGADQVDTLAALDQWLASGTAPDRLIATRLDGSMTRPLCAWPQVARYRGEGDANAPASYECVARD